MFIKFQSDTIKSIKEDINILATVLNTLYDKYPNVVVDGPCTKYENLKLFLSEESTSYNHYEIEDTGRNLEGNVTLIGYEIFPINTIGNKIVNVKINKLSRVLCSIENDQYRMSSTLIIDMMTKFNDDEILNKKIMSECNKKVAQFIIKNQNFKRFSSADKIKFIIRNSNDFIDAAIKLL